MAIFKTTLSGVFESLGLNESALVESVAQHEREVRRANDEHAKITGIAAAGTVSVSSAQIETFCRDFLPFNLQGLAPFMAPGVIEAVGEDAGHGAVPGVTVSGG